MVIVASSGGDYSADSPFHSFDFLEPYLRAIFGFVGIADIDVIHAQPMDITPAVRRAALLKAYDEARAIAADPRWARRLLAETVQLAAAATPAPVETAVGS